MLNKNIIEMGLDYELIHANEDDTEKIYRVAKIEKDFFPVSIKGAVITTNKKDIIKQIYIDFPDVMDLKFYRFLEKKYGAPKYLLKPNLIDDNAAVDYVENGIEITEKVGTAVHCEFTDNPVTIFWDFPDHTMTFNLLHQQNKTELLIISKGLE